MADVIDELAIEIGASSKNAEKSIKRLVLKLDELATSIESIQSRGITDLSNSITQLASSMQAVTSIKTASFSRLAENINKLSSFDTSRLQGIPKALNELVVSLNQMSAVSQNAQNVGVLAGNIAKLGQKSTTNAIANIPLLTKGLNDLLVTLSKAPTVSTNVIQMTNALANLATQGSKVGTASTSLVRGLNRYSTASNRASKSTFSLAAAFGKFYASYFLIIRGLKGVWNSIESTADYIEAYNYYNVAFGKIASDWEEDWQKYGYENGDAYAQSFNDRMTDVMSKMSGVQIDLDTGLLTETGLQNLGMNIQEVTEFASRLASVTNSVGQVGEVSLATAESLTRLAGDISSLFNLDFKEVAQNLQSGIIGQSRALYKFGLDITAATLQTYAYGLGLEKSVSEMTQAEKMQLRLIAILDQSKVSWGDLANTIQSPSNQMRILSNNIKELGNVFGQLFIPMLSKVLPYVNGLTIALKRLFVNLAGFMGIDIDLDAFGQGYNDSLDNTADGFDEVADSIEKTNKALRGFDELKTITSADTVSLSGVDKTGNTIDLTDEIIKATGEYESAWNRAFAKMETDAQGIADILTVKFENAAVVLKDLVPALEGIGTALVTYKIVNGITNLATAIATGFGPAAGVAIGVGVVVALAQAINGVWKELKESDFEERFGDITLSAKELEEVAKAIIDNKNLEQVGVLLSEVGENADISKNIDNAVKKLDQMNWKVSIGMALKQEEESEYKSAIQSYISNMNTLIDNEQYSISMGVSLFLGESEEGSAVQTTVDSFYNSQRTKLEELGAKLNDAVNKGWEDGLFDIDEAKVVMEIQQQMAKIQSTLATSQTTAKLQLLEAEYSGAELTPDTYKELVKKREQLLNEYKEDLNESLTYTIAGVNVSYQEMFNNASTEQAKREIKDEWDKAVSDLISGRDNQITDMMLKSLSFDYNTLINTFGSELDGVSEEIQNELSWLMAQMTMGDVNYLETDIKSLMNKIKKLMSEEAGKEGASNYAEIIKSMLSAEDIEEIAQSIYEQTGSIPEEISEALLSKYALEAISGSVDSLYKWIYTSSENSEEKKKTLEYMKKMGINIPGWMKDGITSNTDPTMNSITSFMGMVEEHIKTFSFYDSMYKTGEKSANGLLDGMKKILPEGINASNFAPLDISNFQEDFQKEVAKNYSLFAGTNIVIESAIDKAFEKNFSSNKTEFDVKVVIEPNESGIVDAVITEINQRTFRTGKTPIVMAVAK